MSGTSYVDLWPFQYVAEFFLEWEYQNKYISFSNFFPCLSQWSRGLRRRSAAARLLRLWVRIPPAMDICLLWVLCVLSGRGLCDELITRSEESYRLWRVVVCDLETSWMRKPWPTGGCRSQKKNNPPCIYRAVNEICGQVPYNQTGHRR